LAVAVAAADLLQAYRFLAVAVAVAVAAESLLLVSIKSMLLQ
jgi:hypothetical protein